MKAGVICLAGSPRDREHKSERGENCHRVKRYDAKHAFMNEMRPEVYHAASAKLAWDRTLSFLKKVLA